MTRRIGSANALCGMALGVFAFASPLASSAAQPARDAKGVTASWSDGRSRPGTRATVPPWTGKGGDPAHVIHVRAGTDGAQDGTSWTDAYASFPDALKALTADRNEIWIAGTNVLTQASPMVGRNHAVTLRGGFDGSENAPSERKAGVESVIDGADAYQTLAVNNWQPVTVERLCLRRSSTYGLAKYGNGALTVSGCRFVANATKSGGLTLHGRGLHVEGGNERTSVVTIEGCVFEGNIDSAGAYDGGYGAGLYLAKLQEATVSDCLFVTNGYDWARTVGTSTRTVGGTALYSDAVPVTVTRCRFVGNTAFASDGCGIVRLANNCDGSSFDHCLWVGNRETKGISNADNGTMGMLVVDMKDIDRSVSVNHCTFAYNYCGTVVGAAGVSVMSGAAAVSNSVFYGNVVPAANAGDNDVQVVGSAGRAIVAYSALDHVPASATCSHLASGTPHLVTPLADFLSCIDAAEPAYPKTAVQPTTVAFKPDAATLAALLAIDVHGLSVGGYYKNDGQLYEDASVTSSAVDAGNPADDFSNEGYPNGGIVNAGVYGNTAEAAHSNVGQPTLSAKDIAVTWVDGWSQPQVSVTAGISAGSDYTATVTVSLGRDGETWPETHVFSGVHPGQVLTHLSNLVFDPEADRLYVSVSVSAAGAEDVSVLKDTAVEGRVPPWAGRGGDPAKVVHLRIGAYGAQDGTSWTEAYASLDKALAALTAERNELWIAGTNVLAASTTTFSPAFACALRGGFAGRENAAAERTAGALAVIDGNARYTPFTAENTGTVTFERICFRNGLTADFEKRPSAGSLAFEGCVFADVVRDIASHTETPHGVSLVGSSDDVAPPSSVARFTGCLFTNLVTRAQNAWSPGRGFGAYIRRMKRVELDGCTFVRCGRPPGEGRSSVQYDFATFGAAIDAAKTPVSATGCRFVGCALNDSGKGGGIVTLQGDCGGSAFTNCAWIANECFWGGMYALGSNSAALVVNADTAGRTVDVQNCTFAFNLSDAGAAPADINVAKGAVTVGNSIFWGEVTNGFNCVGKALHVREGSCRVTYSLFASADDLGAAAGATLETSGLLFADPRLVCRYDAFTNALLRVNCTRPGGQGSYGRIGLPATFDADVAPLLNAHLRGASGYVDEKTGLRVGGRGRTSPAVDAGDPASACGREPAPNGSRVNMGCYGNTPWATMSAPGMTVIVR